ncbi:AbiU2 domain-containing protein [Bradyrhizobium diazoefficiens]
MTTLALAQQRRREGPHPDIAPRTLGADWSNVSQGSSSATLSYSEFAISSACRVTDPWIDNFGNKNLTVGLFTNLLSRFQPLHQRLVKLQTSLEEHRERIKDARNKLTAHADLETIMAGEPIGAATWPQWHQFWKDLGEFVSLINENVNGSPFEIRAAGVRGDAEMMLKKLQN